MFQLYQESHKYSVAFATKQFFWNVACIVHYLLRSSPLTLFSIQYVAVAIDDLWKLSYYMH